MIIFGVIIAIGFTTMMIKPIYNLASGVQIVGTGNLDYQIEVKTKDEIGSLAKQFNKMTGELKIAQEEMFKKKLLEEQFSLAEGIQTSLIPIDTYSTQHVEIVGFYRSALGVGGDYYDFFKIDEERTAVIICDVAGKGIPASLIMVQIRTIFRTFMDLQSTSAAKLVELVNNTLCQSLQAGLFATMLFIIYNSKTKELMFSNAGHGPLEYLSVKTNKIEKITVESPPTGVMPGVKYEDKKVKMSAGDIVYLYTDGISEAMSMTREEYGNERLEGMIKKNAKASAEYINSSLISDLAEFVGDAEQSDDISLIVMKIKQ
jgi:sigma-B regulation protein RsbU (phosphoserine phosphatase)